jgi:hypothetical protein
LIAIKKIWSGYEFREASPLLLNAAIWRHHINGRSRYRSNSGGGEFNRDVVHVEVQYLDVVAMFGLASIIVH